MSIEIRKALPTDNSALIDLTRAAPMEGVLTAYLDRAPDFFAVSSLQGSASQTYVAHDGERIVGCATCIDRTVTYSGRTVRQMYGADMKVEPSARGGRIAKELVRFFYERSKKQGYDMFMSAVMGNNNAALKLVRWINDNVTTAYPAGRVHNVAILPFRRYAPIADYTLGPARPEDLPRIAELLRSTYERYNDRPEFSVRQLADELGRDPSFSLSCFRVARRRGEIVAIAAFWDQHAIRRTTVLEYNWQGKLLISAVRAARRWIPLADPPAPGEPLRSKYLRYPGCVQGEIDGLRAILRAELETIRKERIYHFIWAGFHETDPLRTCLDGLWKFGVDAVVFHGTASDDLALLSPEQAARIPTYVDPSLV